MAGDPGLRCRREVVTSPRFHNRNFAQLIRNGKGETEAGESPAERVLLFKRRFFRLP